MRLLNSWANIIHLWLLSFYSTGPLLSENIEFSENLSHCIAKKLWNCYMCAKINTGALELNWLKRLFNKKCSATMSCTPMFLSSQVKRDNSWHCVLNKLLKSYHSLTGTIQHVLTCANLIINSEFSDIPRYYDTALLGQREPHIVYIIPIFLQLSELTQFV